MRKADNLPRSCAVVTKSGDLNFLETSGPLRDCNGNALPLHETGTSHRSEGIKLLYGKQIQELTYKARL